MNAKVVDFMMNTYIKRKFSKSPGFIRKIPLNPPLQKGEQSECPDLLRCYHKTGAPQSGNGRLEPMVVLRRALLLVASLG